MTRGSRHKGTLHSLAGSFLKVPLPWGTGQETGESHPGWCRCGDDCPLPQNDNEGYIGYFPREIEATKQSNENSRNKKDDIGNDTLFHGLISSLDTAVKSISELEGRNHPNWTQREKSKKKESIRWLWDKVKWSNICAIGVSEWKKWEQGRWTTWRNNGQNFSGINEW